MPLFFSPVLSAMSKSGSGSKKSAKQSNQPAADEVTEETFDITQYIEGDPVMISASELQIDTDQKQGQTRNLMSWHVEALIKSFTASPPKVLAVTTWQDQGMPFPSIVVSPFPIMVGNDILESHLSRVPD
jgi:hypothetical protein